MWAKSLTSKAPPPARAVDLTAYDDAAKALYGALLGVAAWSQIGEETRTVWRIKAYHQALGTEDWWSHRHQKM